MQASKCAVRSQSYAAAPCLQRVQRARRLVCRASHRDSEQQQQSPLQHITAFAASAAIATAAFMSPLPAMADLVQTVPASQVTEMAKPLPKPSIDKGKVWVVFIGGAASLFILTVAAENNKYWFPAIARANEAMAVARKRAEQAEPAPAPADIETTAVPAAAAELPPLEVESAALEAEIARRNADMEAALEQAELERQAKIFEEGLLSARKKVLDPPAAPTAGSSSSSSSNTSSAAAAAEPASSTNGAESSNSSSSSSHSNGSSGPAVPAAEAELAAEPAQEAEANSSGYTVVSDAGSVPAAVAWQGNAAGEAAAAPGSSSKGQPVSAAALAGVLEGRESMQQYKEQQYKEQQQQQQPAEQVRQ